MDLERNELAANIGVDQFIGSCVVKNLSELVECDNDGVFIVPACYDGIYEGVDMWLSDSAGKMIPRYYWLYSFTQAWFMLSLFIIVVYLWWVCSL